MADAATLVEETLRTLDDLVTAGKSPCGLPQFLGLAPHEIPGGRGAVRLTRHVAHQAYYSLVGRRNTEWN